MGTQFFHSQDKEMLIKIQISNKLNKNIIIFSNQNSL